VEWRGENFDCILLCVDCASNWVLARHTLKEGLTRAKAKGRAEVAGRTVINVLRKIQAYHYINWVVSLPWVLRLRHDLPQKKRLGLRHTK